VNLDYFIAIFDGKQHSSSQRKSLFVKAGGPVKPQVIRFTAALPAVMNGTELRKQDLGAVSLLAPRLRLSAPADQRSQLRLLVPILSGAGFS
jgi:hypothetical protein